MRSLPRLHVLSAIAALSASAMLAACNGGVSSSFSPLSSISNARHHVGPLATVSTFVGIKNDWIQTIVGSGSAPCWTISPKLPSVAPGDLSAPVTLSYNTLCVTPANLPITYGPGPAATSNCTFTVAYNGTSFTYSVTQGTNTACTATPSPNTHYDEFLTYAQVPSGTTHNPRLHGAHASPQSHSVTPPQIKPGDAYDNVVTYARGIGFPNAQHYGNDGSGNPVGMTFGVFTGTMSQPYAATLTYAQNHGFPNGHLYGNDGSGNPIGLYYQ